MIYSEMLFFSAGSYWVLPSFLCPLSASSRGIHLHTGRMAGRNTYTSTEGIIIIQIRTIHASLIIIKHDIWPFMTHSEKTNNRALFSKLRFCYWRIYHSFLHTMVAQSRVLMELSFVVIQVKKMLNSFTYLSCFFFPMYVHAMNCFELIKS